MKSVKMFGSPEERSVLFPHKMWERSPKVPKRRGHARGWPVMVGWMFRNTCEHWLVSEINLGLYHGVTVNRETNKLGSFSGMLGDPYQMASLVSKGVNLDRACGICDFSVAEVFERMGWNMEMIKDVKPTR